MKILFLVLGRQMPSSRFRVLQYLPLLKENRVRLRVLEQELFPSFPLMDKIRYLFLFMRTLWGAGRHDLVFLQKPGFMASHWTTLRLLFAVNRRIVFDFDDAIFINPDTGDMTAGPELKRLEFILRRCVAVIAGNPYLAEYAKKYNPRIEIIPTVVDSDRFYPQEKRSADHSVTIGWMGTKPNLPYLLRLLPVMKQVLAGSNARFLIISDLAEKPSPFACSERIGFKTWRAETEVDDLRLFDIGIMPLDDDPFTRGKCGFKLLQYMAMAIPVVASPVGINNAIVEDGSNGFLAGPENAWLECLLALCQDGSLRQRLGAAGREKVIREYSLRRWSGYWLDFVLREAGR